MSHVWRPLIVILALVAAILIARYFVVPPDFGIWESGYMYGWHRKGSEKFWMDFRVGHQGNEYCQGCHPENFNSLSNSKHAILKCENCHGPATGHPDNPPKLPIPNSREMCLRCHTKLPYPTSLRSQIPGFLNPDEHNPGIMCSVCHNPHNPNVTGAGVTDPIFNSGYGGLVNGPR